MFVRTGVDDYELAVVVSDPDAATGGWIGVIAIESILALQHADKPITLNPAQDFVNGYDAGQVPVNADQLRRIRRWIAAGQIITVYTTAGGQYRFGRIPREKLGLTPEQDCWLVGWRDSMDYEADRRRAEMARQRPPEGGRLAAVRPAQACPSRSHPVKKQKESLKFEADLRQLAESGPQRRHSRSAG